MQSQGKEGCRCGLLPSVQLHSSLNIPPSQYTSLFLSFRLLPFPARTPPGFQVPQHFMVLLACFVSAAQDLSSSPSLETADSGLSEHSVSLLSNGFQQKLQSVFSEREVVQGKKYHCHESYADHSQKSKCCCGSSWNAYSLSDFTGN